MVAFYQVALCLLPLCQGNDKVAILFPMFTSIDIYKSILSIIIDMRIRNEGCPTIFFPSKLVCWKIVKI